jgi:hypothetical protein
MRAHSVAVGSWPMLGEAAGLYELIERDSLPREGRGHQSHRRCRQSSGAPFDGSRSPAHRHDSARHCRDQNCAAQVRSLSGPHLLPRLPPLSSLWSWAGAGRRNGERPIPCHNHATAPGLTSLSSWRGSVWIRRIPCHLARSRRRLAGVVPVITTAQPLVQAIGALLAQPDLAGSTLAPTSRPSIMVVSCYSTPVGTRGADGNSAVRGR